jgi:DNA invertase Pin-like site-specific DNA recombinase
MKQIGVYLSVSTNAQTADNQRRELEAVAKRSGWQVVRMPVSRAPRVLRMPPLAS